jgi:hypothetical protein
MAVQNYLASAARDPSKTPPSLLPVQVRMGHLKNLISVKDVANGDSATSTIEFGEIPSSAIISPLSQLESDAITSLTDFDLGIGRYEDGNGFVLKDADCLINGADLHTAGSVKLTAIDIENRGKRAWEIAGYADDPGGNLTVVGTLNIATTAAGTIALNLVFATE